MHKHSKILWEAYESFLLPLGGKKVPVPYRINIPPLEHPARQGKSSPQIIIRQLKKDALEQKFNLSKASVEEIRQFMIKNHLGIDCSGFAYRLLNYLIQKLKSKSLESFGLPHIGRTNVAKLTSPEFTIPVKKTSDVKAGDIIKLNGKPMHCMIVIEVNRNYITYAHPSETSRPSGVHLQRIKKVMLKSSLENQLWLERFKRGPYNPRGGDEVRRLKFL